MSAPPPPLVSDTHPGGLEVNHPHWELIYGILYRDGYRCVLPQYATSVRSDKPIQGGTSCPRGPMMTISASTVAAVAAATASGSTVAPRSAYASSAHASSAAPVPSGSASISRSADAASVRPTRALRPLRPLRPASVSGASLVRHSIPGSHARSYRQEPYPTARIATNANAQVQASQHNWGMTVLNSSADTRARQTQSAAPPVSRNTGTFRAVNTARGSSSMPSSSFASSSSGSGSGSASAAAFSSSSSSQMKAPEQPQKPSTNTWRNVVNPASPTVQEDDVIAGFGCLSDRTGGSWECQHVLPEDAVSAEGKGKGKETDTRMDLGQKKNANQNRSKPRLNEKEKEGQPKVKVCGTLHDSARSLVAHYHKSHSPIDVVDPPYWHPCPRCDAFNNNYIRCVGCYRQATSTEERWVCGRLLPTPEPGALSPTPSLPNMGPDDDDEDDEDMDGEERDPDAPPSIHPVIAANFILRPIFEPKCGFSRKFLAEPCIIEEVGEVDKVEEVEEVLQVLEVVA